MPQNAKTIVQNATKSKLKLIAAGIILIFWTLLSAGTPAQSAIDFFNVSAKAKDTSKVWFTTGQADSIMALINRQDWRIQRLKVDLWEQRQYAILDSTWAEAEQERYQTLLKHQDSWLERIYNNKMLWFVLGVYLGVRASNYEGG